MLISKTLLLKNKIAIKVGELNNLMRFDTLDNITFFKTKTLTRVVLFQQRRSIVTYTGGTEHIST